MSCDMLKSRLRAQLIDFPRSIRSSPPQHLAHGQASSSGVSLGQRLGDVHRQARRLGRSFRRQWRSRKGGKRCSRPRLGSLGGEACRQNGQGRDTHFCPFYSVRPTDAMTCRAEETLDPDKSGTLLSRSLSPHVFPLILDYIDDSIRRLFLLDVDSSATVTSRRRTSGSSRNTVVRPLLRYLQ